MSKTEVLFRLIDPGSLRVSQELIRKINDSLLRFIWGNKHRYIRKEDEV